MQTGAPTSGLPVSLEEKLRRLLLWLIPVAILAVVGAWLAADWAKEFSWTAYLGLPLIATLFVGVWGLVLTRRIALLPAQVALVGFPSFYMLANQLELSWSGVLYREGDPVGWLWTPVLYLLTFLVLPGHQARRCSWGFLLGQVLVYFLSLGRHGSTLAQLNYALQYFVASGIYVCVLGVYAELKQRFSLAQSQAETDALTGLTNRRRMQVLLEQAVQGADPFAVLLLDIDHFKDINDRFGHNAGDVVLREVSQCMSQCLRDRDLVSRWGGEEFILLLPEVDLTEAAQIAERILQATRTRTFAEGIQLTVSIGAALYQRGERPEDIVHRADIALYKAKQSGRNQVVVSTASRLVA